MRVALNSSSRRFLQRAPQIPLDNFDNPQRFTHRLCIAGLLKKKKKKILSESRKLSKTVMDTLGIVVDPS